MIGSRCKVHCRDLPNSSKFNFSSGYEEIVMVNNTKYFGLQFDNQVKWSTHLSTMTMKVSRCIGMLNHKLQNFKSESLR